MLSHPYNVIKLAARIKGPYGVQSLAMND